MNAVGTDGGGSDRIQKSESGISKSEEMQRTKRQMTRTKVISNVKSEAQYNLNTQIE